MAVAAVCTCGASFELKDEYAGQVLACPTCGQPVQATARAVPVLQYAAPAFRADKFLLRQKHLAINQKYYVWDEQGQPLLFIERPALVGRNLLAVLAAIVTFAVMAGGMIFLAVQLNRTSPSPILIILGVVLGVIAALVVAVAVHPKRHVRIYQDDTRQTLLLEIIQENKWQLINAYYTLQEPAGEVLARFQKNYLVGLLRKRWDCQQPDGTMLCRAMEDSMILSLLRRFIGPLYGILRTNFIIVRPDEQVIGEFNRKLTILDRYVLDLSADAEYYLDRRIAVALGVLLDTGERR